MGELGKDLRYGARMLLRAPVVSAVAVVSLAIGITANAMQFSILNGFFFEPYPYERPDELVFISQINRASGNRTGISAANLVDLAEGQTTLEALEGYTVESANLTGTDRPLQVSTMPTAPGLLHMLGVRPERGRLYDDGDLSDNDGRVVVLHHDFWQGRLLGDPGVLGRTLELDGVAYTVVGVLPADFDMIPANVEIFRPIDLARRSEGRDVRTFQALARLRPGVDAAAVEADLDRVMASLEETYPDANRGFGVSVQPLRDVFPGPTDTRLLLLLTAVSLFVLLIACANVANLLLARAEARQREIAVRTALGAGRTRIVRQLLTESVLLALLAGGLGTLAAVKGVAWLSAQMPPELPDAFDPALRPEVLLATLATALAAGVLFGLAPALHAVSGDLRSGLGEGARGGTAGARRKRLRSVFVVGQLAVALTLLTGAGILAQAFNEQLSLDPRFDAEGLLTFQVALPEYRYADDAARVQGIERIERALEADPRIAFAAPVTFVPRGQSLAQRFFTVEGVEAAEDAEPPAALYQAVSPGFFEGLGVEVRRGRGIDRGDRAETEPVVVVNEALVRRYLDDGEPLGRRLVIGGVAHTVVGVVRDFVQQRIVDDTGVAPAVFVPFAQHPARATAFLVRAASSEPGDLAAAVREAVWSVDPDQPIGQVATFERFVADSLAGPRAIGLFLAVFGVLALLLSAIGIYGVMAQTVGQQTREIGIRLALGAERGQVVGLVTRQGMMLAGLGLLIGLPLSWAMIRAIEATLSGVSVFRPGLFAWVLGGLTAASLLATYLPARRAARVEPVRALQGD